MSAQSKTASWSRLLYEYSTFTQNYSKTKMDCIMMLIELRNRRLECHREFARKRTLSSCSIDFRSLSPATACPIITITSMECLLSPGSLSSSTKPYSSAKTKVRYAIRDELGRHQPVPVMFFCNDRHSLRQKKHPQLCQPWSTSSVGAYVRMHTFDFDQQTCYVSSQDQTHPILGSNEFIDREDPTWACATP